MPARPIAEEIDLAAVDATAGLRDDLINVACTLACTLRCPCVLPVVCLRSSASFTRVNVHLGHFPFLSTHHGAKGIELDVAFQSGTRIGSPPWDVDRPLAWTSSEPASDPPGVGR